MEINKSNGGKNYLLILSLTALGVVYGDIGTSPLYAMRECFQGPFAVEPTPANIFGVLSLIFWSLLIVISLKYLLFILRADNHGEGGILALTALVISRKKIKSPEREEGEKRNHVARRGLVLIGIFGAALLYGDGMITPAISVLSAVEGLEIATPFFRPWIIPLTIAILILLFSIQNRGTGKVGAIFGPITLLWFLVIALLGVNYILQTPEILGALNPVYGLNFFIANSWRGFLVLGAVFLVVTGGEALYADMGHFGAKPIRLTWFALVLPSLLLNYFGQGGLLLRNPSAASNPFYSMSPEWALYPIVILATGATVIASQALISGAFSLTMQGVQLGYLPRLRITHTSARERGQIYVPTVNWILLLACIGLVIGFSSSSNLAAAYGVSVTATMGITTILFGVIVRRRWGWSLWLVIPFVTFFLLVDLAFLGANLTKILHGGWFPLLVGGILFTLMTTWKTGRRILEERIGETIIPLDELLLYDDKPDDLPVRVPGTAVFLTRDPQSVPPPLVRNLRHNKVLHERNILLTVLTTTAPLVRDKKRVKVERLGSGIWQVTLTYGFMQSPDVPRGLKEAHIQGVNWRHVTYFLGRESIVVTPRPGMAIWREHLFALMSRNTRSAASWFHIPPDQVVEIGARVEI
ncbi:MAG: potassium uptake protein [Ignavibacteriae bacterium]|nr:potassium uptake protein [Ignavibacteriota bacterium]MCB9214741.1 potassium uptake protein [Ignavibacteria bacterium]